MKAIFNLILGLLVFTACTNQEAETPIEKQKLDLDSTTVQPKYSHAKAWIEEPFLVSDIDKLEFTSGGAGRIEKHKKCDSTNTGFYGSYFLIDPDYADEMGRPVGGVITIYKNGSMADWKSIDTNQTIWLIHLKSDVIAVWDSIAVGSTRNEIERFGKLNNGLCIKKGDAYYSCNFNNFSVVYTLEKDTVTELTVSRNCEEIE